jgi:hypothetical protein
MTNNKIYKTINNYTTTSDLKHNNYNNSINISYSKKKSLNKN